MTAIFVILIIVFLLLTITLLPVTVSLSYKDELTYIFKYAGITVFNSQKKINIKSKKSKKKNKNLKAEEPSPKNTDQNENFLKKIYNQKGFSGTVKYFAKLLQIIIKRLWWVIKKFEFRHFYLNLTVASDDSAETAIEYGGACCAVYPVLALLESITNFKMQQVNINADFNKTKPEFQISFSFTTRLIYWLIAVASAVKEYFKFKNKESENNE